MDYEDLELLLYINVVCMRTVLVPFTGGGAGLVSAYAVVPNICVL